MDSTKYQVFISSTYKDLEEERESIIKAILEMYHIPIGMEMFSAEDEEQWEIIRRTIDVSDYYVLILGLRYGSKTSDEISFTQKEYEYALEKKIPILAFVMSDDVSLPKSRRDDDLTDINAFRTKVLQNSKMAQFWETKDELIKSVSISLMKQIMQKPGIGWVRGDKLGVEEDLSKELTSLSKENRDLRSRILELESQVNEKLPQIEVSIGPVKSLSGYTNSEKVAVPDAFTMHDVPEKLAPYVNQEDIDSYNENLPTREEVDIYNSEFERIEKINFTSTPLVIRVSNSGRCKANNIFIEITFPDGVFIREDGEDINAPKLKFPNSPLIQAEKRYQKFLEEQRAKENPFRELSRASALDRISAINTFNRRDIDSIVGNLNNIRTERKNWTRLNGNKLTIKIESLLHTRILTFDNKYLISILNTEDYEISLNVICEEYDSDKDSVLLLPQVEEL
ncbi:DUF4062 domain-containing protein [Vibrio harveyi]|uniref:DUF4062 domain-containing protein n=1 Tax=Vibrio harveyi TaxID=669 RepID=UPI00066E6D10|nr:DUF4062 domain-containing protein [Vibrio harveyi]